MLNISETKRFRPF